MSKLIEPTIETTLRVRDACLCLHAQRAARALARRFDEAFRPLRLTSGQFSLLVSLNRPQPPAIGPVAEVLGMDRTTVTAALKPLQRRGLVEVVPDPHDKRGRLLRLTTDGRALLRQAVPVWERAHYAVESSMPATDANSLRAALRTLSRQRP